MPHTSLCTQSHCLWQANECVHLGPELRSWSLLAISCEGILLVLKDRVMAKLWTKNKKQINRKCSRVCCRTVGKQATDCHLMSRIRLEFALKFDEDHVLTEFDTNR